MIQWILSSSVLILIVLVLRQMLKGRVSSMVQYGLWSLVLLRLLIPFSFAQTQMSVENLTKQPQLQAVEQIVNAQMPDYTESQNDLDYDVQIHGETISQSGERAAADDEAVVPNISIGAAAMAVWLAGGIIVMAFIVGSNLRFRAGLRKNQTRLDTADTCLPVYVSDFVPSSCLVGVFHPTIYLTPDVAENDTQRRYVLEHEMTHYYHCDYMIAPLRCVALILHWYNPLVWIAGRISRLDSELACDEGTIKRLGEAERVNYGRTLIALTCEKRMARDMTLAATSIGSGSKEIRERVKRIAKQPRMALITLVAVIVSAVLAVGCTFTGAQTTSDGLPEQTPGDGQTETEETIRQGNQPTETAVTPAQNESGNEGVSMQEVIASLEDGNVPVTLALNGGEAYDGREISNAAYYSGVIASCSYSPEDIEMELPEDGDEIVLKLAENRSLRFFSNGLVMAESGDGKALFRTDAYDSVRYWFDEAEWEALGGSYNRQDAIVIEDRGQDYLVAALEYCHTLERTHTLVTSGSAFGYSYVMCAVEPAEYQTELMRQTNEVGENTWCFYLTTVFVPENERALAYSMAGNTREYEGNDASVPQGAYEYQRCGYITKADGVWRCEIVGTGW